MLHNVDFEQYPEEHCRKTRKLWQNGRKQNQKLVHAICSHGYGLCSDVEPEHEMEKVLFEQMNLPA